MTRVAFRKIHAPHIGLEAACGVAYAGGEGDFSAAVVSTDSAQALKGIEALFGHSFDESRKESVVLVREDKFRLLLKLAGIQPQEAQ